MWQVSMMGKAAAIAAKLNSSEIKCDDLEKDTLAKAIDVMVSALKLFPDGAVAQISANGHQVEVSEDGKNAVNYLNIVINPIQGFVETAS